ncbi:unnamed protein product [Acanthoscelides obtectus]|uniref:Uncharacterized protein n=1 Tax=Acanthoscelides obtectus TaxID=200917 RepID=A0A9P0M644_ACAOB|nr:unnamed protein product [Acanthoscelides obtectus]
MTSNVFFTQ